MESGGAWLGFHVAAYNDKDSNWLWFVDSGRWVFHTNSGRRCLPMLTIDDAFPPVPGFFPHQFPSPDNEWYIWKPSLVLKKRLSTRHFGSF